MSGITSVEFAIAGGGVAGLSAAYHLSQLGCHDYLIIEREKDIGGASRSIQTPDHFTFDYASHILFTKSKYIAQLYDTILGYNRLVKQREAWIFSNGVFSKYPFQANLFGLPVDIVYECLFEFIKVQEKPYTTDHLDFYSWIELTFGGGIAKHFMFPYNRKLWKYPLHLMSPQWVGNRVVRPSLEDVIRGALTNQQKGFGSNSIFIYPKRGGINVIPVGLYNLLGDDKNKVITQAAIIRINLIEQQLELVNGDIVSYHNLIFTLPLPYLSGLLLDPFPDTVLQAILKLEYNRHYCLLFGIKGKIFNQWMRIYLPEEDFLAHRLGFPRAIAPTSAPDGWGSIYAEITEPRIPTHKLSEDEMVEKTISDLCRIGIIDKYDQIEFKGCLVLDPAYPIYTLSRDRDVEIIHQFLAQYNIYPAGRFADWRYFNIDHTILSAKSIVESIARRNENGRKIT